jgi:hypothetical protein
VETRSTRKTSLGFTEEIAWIADIVYRIPSYI